MVFDVAIEESTLTMWSAFVDGLLDCIVACFHSFLKASSSLIWYDCTMSHCCGIIDTACWLLLEAAAAACFRICPSLPQSWHSDSVHHELDGFD